MAQVSKCLKYSMFVFNVLFWISGCIILGVAIALRISKDAQKYFGLDASASSASHLAMDVLIGVGATTMVVGFLGCCGAIKENRFMLATFFVLLFVILLIQIAVGALAVVYHKKVEEKLPLILQKYLPLSKNVEFAEHLKSYQTENRCCGLLNGYSDWAGNIPESCICVPEDGQPDLCTETKNAMVYAKTCQTAMEELFKGNLVIIIGICFVLGVVEIIGLALSMTLCCQIGKP
ncbi:tetraspanin-8 isoform X1 [Ambystoma mexicanum]|uniref:tetraspanin-8 isoform X1 n=1 Tax=Ambystoma mexicanum TaxID=8296 RepID=UPI0037E87BF8